MSKKSGPPSWPLDRSRIDYTLSIEDYHANRSHLSKTPIAKILTSPAHFVYARTSAEDEDESDALRVGQAFHLAVEGMDKFLSSYHVMPDKTRRAADEQPYKAELAIAGDRKILKKSEFDAAVAMSESITNSKVVQMFDGYEQVTEPTLIWSGFEGLFEDVGLKYRPDRLCYREDDDEAVVFDWKSAASAKPERFERVAFDKCYDISVALADAGIRKVMGRRLTHYYFVAVEKYAPNVVQVFDALLPTKSGSYLDSGKLRLYNALEKYEECRKKGSWPGYSDSVLPMTIPSYELYRIEQELKNK